MGGCLGSTGVNANVEFAVWLKTTAQVGPIVPGLCYDKVATRETAIFFCHIWQTTSYSCLSTFK